LIARWRLCHSSGIPARKESALRRPIIPGALLLVALATLPGAAWAASNAVKLDGYLEFQKPDFLIIDAQRVKATAATKFKGAGTAKNPATIPPGYAVKVKGTRATDGTIVASEIEAKPNGMESMESQVLAGTNHAESTWVAAKKIVEPGADGKEVSMGALQTSGGNVARASRIVDRVLPPYVDRSKVRVYVVENPEWNAMAMANFSIYVYNGLMADMNDDELAIVLGHEIAHATYEHSRRQASKSQVSGIAGQLAMIGASQIGNPTARAAAQQATQLGYSAFGNSYSRDYEDQADRVGLRYVFEAGYDYNQAPKLWRRFAEKYKDSSKLENFFFGNHSLSTERAAALEREIRNNAHNPGDLPTHPATTAPAPANVSKQK
jgi:Zn-dependent protease with chaperone function